MIKSYIKKIILTLPVIGEYHKFKYSITNKVTLYTYIRFIIKRKKIIYWPIAKTTEVTHPQNIFIGINSNAGTRHGCYLQGNGKIFIGDYVHFASNIGVLSGNHGLYNHMEHTVKETIIGDYSWLGMNCVILPGVILGPRTIVGAGSVVTKSFPDGYCVIAGNPAKLIKVLDKDKFVKHHFEEEYYGFIPKYKFEKFRNDHLQKINFDYDVSSVTDNPFYKQ